MQRESIVSRRAFDAGMLDAAAGLAGPAAAQLAVMKRGYYVRRRPSLMLVRLLANPARPFKEAAAEFEAKRKATLTVASRSATPRAAERRGLCLSPDGRRACQRDEDNALAQA
jgi:hypothetical protein